MSEDPLARLLSYQLAARHCPGAIAHVERAGTVLARHAVGRAGPTDAAPAMHAGVRFKFASLTKPIVSMAALMLVDEGRIELDAPVASHLPALAEMRLAGGERPQRAPSVRDLMRHTAGLPYPQEIADPTLRAAWTDADIGGAMNRLDRDTLLGRIAGLPLVHEPGTRFGYGYSTDVLGWVIEQVEQVRLGEVLRKRLFEPLGMNATSFDLDGDEVASAWPDDAAWHATIPAIGRRQPGRPSVDSGGGGLIGTLDDYAAFARLLAAGGEADGQRLLSRERFEQFARNQLPAGVDGPAGFTGPGFGFGLGLAVRHDWGPSAMPCGAGEMTWSGISGTALFVQPRDGWFALLFSANMGSRMMARMEFRRALARF